MTNLIKNFWVQPDGSILLRDWSIMLPTERAEILSQVSSLPIIPQLGSIRDAVRDSIVTIISAETWSWKTTQVPQALRKLYWINNRISVAEPRVIAAVNAANRVSRELIAKTWDPNFALWNKVWYRTWKWVESIPWTELLFVTDWLQLMRQFVSWKVPDILIVDEVHTYSVPTEFLIARSKRLMEETSRRFRLVLMSATLDVDLITNYFSDITRNIPVFNIPWRTYPVAKVFRWEEEFLSSIIEYAQRIPWKSWADAYRNILVFVEWKRKIESTISNLNKHLKHYEILPLHSELPISEQRLVVTKWDKPRIIVATNIAQESITIPYINVVVDNWFGKVLRVNDRWIPELRKEHISKADSEQRAWRAWRVMEWEYVRANSRMLSKLKQFQDWEIENITIERFILLALATWFNPMKELEVSQDWTFIHRPNKDLFKMSYDNLLKLWAITKDHKVTVLWRKLLSIPLEPHLWKMLLEWIKRGCWGNMIDICAILNHKWFFAKSQLWQKFVPWKFKNDSDLIAHRELLNFITTREPLDSETLHKLHHYWLDKLQIEEYKRISNSTQSKMLFEVIDLTSIWVKSKVVHEIIQTRDKLIERLERDWETIEYSEDFVEISKSILSWMLNNLYKWWRKWKKFKHHRKWEFQKPLTSVLNPSTKYFYAWSPFIVWWYVDDENSEDVYLLSFITKINPEWIIEVASPFILEEYFDVEFWEKRVQIGKKSKGKLKPVVLAKKKVTLSWMQIQLTDWEIETAKIKNVLLYSWLPDFLIKNNQIIYKFIKSHNKWIFNVERFKELLQIICKKLFSHYDIKKFESSINSFIHDSQVLFYFKESSDPAIVEFLANPYKEQFNKQLSTGEVDIIAEQNKIAETEEQEKLKQSEEERLAEEKRRIAKEKREARKIRREEKERIKKEKWDVEELKPENKQPEKKKVVKKTKRIFKEKKEDKNKIPRKKKKDQEKLSDRLNWPRQKKPEFQTKKLEESTKEEGREKQSKKTDKKQDLKQDRSKKKPSNSPWKEFKKETEHKKQKNKTPKIKQLTQSTHEREKKKNQRTLKIFRWELHKIPDWKEKDKLKKELFKIETYLKETKWYQYSVSKVNNMILRLKFKIETQLPKIDKTIYPS